MIARTWHGAVPNAKADAYVTYLQLTGISDLEASPGNRGVWVLRRSSADVTDFWLVSFWDSYESIRAFAGEDPERARYYPEDTEYLLELEPSVIHYEVAYHSR